MYALQNESHYLHQVNGHAKNTFSISCRLPSTYVLASFSFWSAALLAYLIVSSMACKIIQLVKSVIKKIYLYLGIDNYLIGMLHLSINCLFGSSETRIDGLIGCLLCMFHRSSGSANCRSSLLFGIIDSRIDLIGRVTSRF